MNLKNINIQLTALTLVIFTAAFFKNDPFFLLEETYESAPYLLPDFHAGDVESIEIFQNEIKLNHLIKQDSGWVLRGDSAETEYIADSSKIHANLVQLEKLRKYYEISENPDRFAEFGLSDRGLKLKVKYSTKESSFYIGNRGTTKGSNLVRMEKGTTVYSVNANLQGQWKQSRDFFRYNRLINFSVENILSVNIKKGRNGYNIVRQNEHWTIQSSSAEFDSENRAKRFFEELLELKGGNFYYSKNTGKPIGTITLTYKSSIREKIEFRRISKELFIVRSDQNPYWQIIPEFKLSGVLPGLNEFLNKTK